MTMTRSDTSGIRVHENSVVTLPTMLLRRGHRCFSTLFAAFLLLSYSCFQGYHSQLTIVVNRCINALLHFNQILGFFPEIPFFGYNCRYLYLCRLSERLLYCAIPGSITPRNWRVCRGLGKGWIRTRVRCIKVRCITRIWLSSQQCLYGVGNAWPWPQLTLPWKTLLSSGKKCSLEVVLGASLLLAAFGGYMTLRFIWCVFLGCHSRLTISGEKMSFTVYDIMILCARVWGWQYSVTIFFTLVTG